MSETNFPKHVFWLGRIEKWVMGQLSQLRLCTIDSEQVVFEGNSRRVTIPLKNIDFCKLSVARGRWHHYEHVHIKLKSKELSLQNHSEPIHYYLAAANPLTLKVDYFPEETRLMVEVINAYINKQPIAANPNPYYREFEQLQKLDYFIAGEWDAVVSPNEYTYRKLPRKLRQRYELDNQLANQFMLWVMAMWLLAIGAITTFMGYWIPTGFMAFLIVMLVLMLGITHWQSRRLTPERLREIAELDRQRV